MGSNHITISELQVGEQYVLIGAALVLLLAAGTAIWIWRRHRT